jgi:hypothetical protein
MMDNTANRAALMLGVGLAVLLAAGLVAFLFMGGAGVRVMLPMIAMVIIFLGIAAIGVAVWQQAQRRAPQRHFSGDVYTMIDKMVADLSADEARFLWRTLHEMDRSELAESLSDLLDAREDERAQGGEQ